MALPKPDPQKYRGGSTSLLYKEDLQAWQDSQQPPEQLKVDVVTGTQAPLADKQTTIVSDPVDSFSTVAPVPSKPDPSNYRGGLTSRLYKDDLAAWEDSQQPPVAPAGQEDVVSLASTFDEEEDPFVPLIDVNALADSGFTVDYGNMDLSSLNDTFEGVTTLGEGITEDDLDDFAVQRQDQYLAELGLTRDDVDPAIFEDNISFATFYQEGLTDKNQKTRQDFSELFASDKEAFSSAYESAGSNDRLNFVYDQYKEGNLEKAEYITLAGQILQDSTDENYKPNAVYFENAGKLYEIPNNFLDAGNPLFFAKEVVLFDDQKLNPNATHYLAEDDENFRRSLGFTNDESADTRSSWVKARDGVILPLARIGLGIATGGQSEQLYSALKLASGETLHGSDWANLAVGGLEKIGVIKPPVDLDADMVNTIGGGTVGSTMTDNLLMGFDGASSATEMVDGVGLLGLDYGATVGVIEGLGSQDAVKVVSSLLPTDKLSGLLEDAGVPSDLAYDSDFIKGVNEGLTTVVGGGSLKDGLEDGLVEYIKEGGSFGDMPDVDLGVIEDVLKPLVDPLLTVVETVGETIEDVVKPVVDPLVTAVETVGGAVEDAGKAVVDPVITAVEDVAPLIEDVIRDVGSAIDDAIIAPVKDVVEAIDLPDLPDIDLPDIDLPDLPDIDLPDIDLPSINLPSIDIDLQIPNIAMPSSTRTTDGLFGKELFKFQTEIGVSPQAALIQAPTRRSAQMQQQPREQYVDLFDDPFDNPFARKV